MNELTGQTGNIENAYSDDDSLYGTQIKSVTAPAKNIGIDIDNQFYDNIIAAGEASQLDISRIESFTNISQNRDTIMQLIDTMCEDSTVSAALEVYAEDATEYNANGKIVWCESADANVAKYIDFLLDSLNVDKNIYRWAYSLCKYGDLYLRLFRESDFDDDLFKTKEEREQESKNKKLNENLDNKEKLDESVIIKAYSVDDRYSHYIEMVPNPVEMFELTRYGKSYAYIKTKINTTKKVDNLDNSYYKYSFKKHDVDLYDATCFVHACLEDNTTRTPEEVDIFLNDNDYNNNEHALTYTVRRGQSILYSVFKIWRQMMLLENSLLLNRLTKSSITRIIGVEVGDMAKESVGQHLMKVKSLIEQKSALDVGNSFEEYTNPGPIENNVYVPTRNQIGSISTQTIGGDVDVKGLADVDYFKNRFYAALRIPKQFIGDTDDSTGFNGGSSLTLVSSRYAKAVKRIQNTLIQALTDAVNLMLIDKGLDSYINRFQIRMQNPTTQEEKDRQESAGSRVNFVNDIMNVISDSIEDQSAKLKIMKSLLSNVISDSEVMDIIDEQIEKLEEKEESGMDTTPEGEDNSLMSSGGPSSFPEDDIDLGDMSDDEFNLDNEEPNEESEEETSDNGETVLPMPSELNAGDFSDLNNPNI